MDLTLEIDTENQQQIQLQLIHDTTIVSISKQELMQISILSGTVIAKLGLDRDFSHS